MYGEKTVRPRPNFGGDDNTVGDDDDDDNDTNEEEEERDDDEELCNDASVNAMVTVKDKTTYAFKVKY